MHAGRAQSGSWRGQFDKCARRSDLVASAPRRAAITASSRRSWANTVSLPAIACVEGGRSSAASARSTASVIALVVCRDLPRASNVASKLAAAPRGRRARRGHARAAMRSGRVLPSPRMALEREAAPGELKRFVELAAPQPVLARGCGSRRARCAPGRSRARAGSRAGDPLRCDRSRRVRTTATRDCRTRSRGESDRRARCTRRSGRRTRARLRRARADPTAPARASSARDRRGLVAAERARLGDHLAQAAARLR